MKSNRPVFFYGLFMDCALLRGRGLHPNPIGPASLPGYRIRIGTRASLMPNPESISYGMLVDLPEAEVAALYSTPDVRDYIAESVKVVLLSDHSERASLCYNLPPDRLGQNVNVRYAEQLSTLVVQQGFSQEYADEIMRQCPA